MHLLVDHIITQVVTMWGAYDKKSIWLPSIQDGVGKNANKHFYELQVITYIKNHIGKNLPKNVTKLHNNIY